MMRLNVGCGTHYAQDWVNTDVVKTETTTPDVVIDPYCSYPFDDNTFDAVFLGHVLEHIPWERVHSFLLDMRRIAKPGAPFLVVGPDIYRTIHRWKDNVEPWETVASVLEHKEDAHLSAEGEWNGALHQWNCHHERVWELLSNAGFKQLEDYFDKIPNNALAKSWYEKKTKIRWPVVGKYHWQFAIKCSN